MQIEQWKPIYPTLEEWEILPKSILSKRYLDLEVWHEGLPWMSAFGSLLWQEERGLCSWLLKDGLTLNMLGVPEAAAGQRASSWGKVQSHQNTENAENHQTDLKNLLQNPVDTVLRWAPLSDEAAGGRQAGMTREGPGISASMQVEAYSQNSHALRPHQLPFAAPCFLGYGGTFL